MSSASRSWWWRGVQVLIPETGKVDEWIGDVDESSGLFFVGAWLVILGGILGLVALVGFYDALREASPAMFVAPGAGVTLLPRWLGWLGLVVGAFAL
ncbi:MAG TPA: hypothetical protein VHI55_08765, partial [Gaiellaceae bacterium]|nr:hypothetical protein [Gaiellaceae bacterium]